MPKYWVDWDDTYYPRIRPWFKNVDENEEPLTLALAKKEIIDAGNNRIRDARDMIAEARKATAASVKADEEERGG